MTLLALKILLAPAFVIGATLVGRHAGVRLAGIVAGLPMIAGPILLVLAIDHGRAFASEAAVGTVLGVVGLMAFVLVYSALAARVSWPVAVIAAWGAFLAVVLAMKPVHVAPYVALAAAALATAVTLLLLPRSSHAPPSLPPPPRWDLALRAVCAIAPVVAVTAVARAVGPHFSGLLASVPVITPVLAAFTQVQRGPLEAVRLLHGMTVGFVGYLLFAFTVAVALRGMTIGPAFGLALVVALATQAVALAVARNT